MEFSIKNHSDGSVAGVTKEGQLKVVSESQALQHHVSFNEENTFQVWDTVAVANATTTVLHLKNDDSERKIVVSNIQVQMIDPSGGTAPPAAANYFDVGYGRTVSSGGSAVTPVNMNTASGKTAAGTFTGNGPTMAGTFTEFDRWYVEGDGIKQVWSKEGSIAIGLNDTMEIRAISDNTGGTAYARVTFMMMPNPV
jgi:hypothetical protein